MSMSNHISVARDIAAVMDYGPVVLTGHNFLSASTGAAGVCPNFEPWLPIFWPPGMAFMKHELTTSVLHSGWWIAQEKHDLGPMQAHIPSVPDDILVVVHIMMAKREARFAAGEVLAEGKPIACCTMFDLSLPTPMTPCSDVPAPIVGTGSAVLLNDVLVGMHIADWLSGVVSIAASAAFDWLTRQAFGDMVRPFLPDPTTILSGLVELAFQEYGDYQGEAGSDVTLLSLGGVFEVKLTASRDPTSGRITVQLDERGGHETYGPRVVGQQSATFGGDEAATFTGDVGGSSWPWVDTHNARAPRMGRMKPRTAPRPPWALAPSTRGRFPRGTIFQLSEGTWTA